MNDDPRVVDAEAEVAALTGDGATLLWTSNDGVATELTYLMLGAP